MLIENIIAKPLNLLKNFDDKRILAVAMRGLTDKEQKLINLRHNDGMSFKEIAEVFQESINTIKSRYRRIVISLKKSAKI